MAQVAALWRYPVTPMPGEEVQRTVVGPEGLLGDRAFAVVAVDDGTVVPAQLPGSRSDLLEFRAAFTAEPEPGAPLPPVDVHFPDGSVLRTDDERIHAALSGVLGREVRVSADPAAGEPPTSDPAPLHLLGTTTPDARDHRPHVVVDTGSGDGADGADAVGGGAVGDGAVGSGAVGDGWVGRTVTVGGVGLSVRGPGPRAGVRAAVVAPGTVAVGDPVTVG